MFCKNCGSALKDGSKFCQFCGTPVTVTPTKIPTVTPPDATVGEEKQPVQETANQSAQETVNEPAEEAVNEPVEEAATEDTPNDDDAVLDGLIEEDEKAAEQESENAEDAEDVGQSAVTTPGENTAYTVPAPAAVPFSSGIPKPEPPKTPFRRALVKVASSPLFLAFAILLTVAAVGQLTGIVSLVKVNGVIVRANFNLFTTLSAALGIVTAVALFKLHSTAKKNPDSPNVLGGANAYVIYKEVCSWLVFALMILLILAAVLMLVATLAPNGMIKEAMNAIDWTEGISFRDSFDGLLNNNIINAVYKTVPYIDEIWQTALHGIYTFTKMVGLNAPADFLYLLYIFEIVALVGLVIGAVASIFSAIYFIKLRKYVSRVRYSWKTNAPFTNKSGFISFFSVVFAVYYVSETTATLFASPLKAIAYGSSAAAFIILIIILKKFKAALAQENAVSVSEQSEQSEQ